MAINEHPDVRCTHPRHRELPPAVGFARDTEGLASVWRPRCNPCVLELAANLDPVPTDVAYLLDPIATTTTIPVTSAPPPGPTLPSDPTTEAP